MKILKSTFFVLLILICGVVVFYFWGSAGKVSKNSYFNVKKYGEPDLVAIDTFTVMTYNIGYLSGMTNNLPMERPESLFLGNLQGLNQLIRKQSPDLIGFQEIDFGSNRSHFTNQMDSVALSCNYAFGYQSINWDKNYVPFPYWPITNHFGQMLSGQAILSKYEIVDSETIILEKPINGPFYYNAFYLDRLVQICQLAVNGRKLTLMNVHMEAFDVETREAQAHVVKGIYNTYADKGPTILLGDFNSQPAWEINADKVMSTFLSGNNIRSAITEENYQASPSNFYTFDSDKPYQMIDYILYNPKYIELIDASVLQNASQISDHLPIVMKFVFSEVNDTMFIE